MMNKKVAKAVLFMLLMAFIMQSSFALGVLPSRKVIDFTPGLEAQLPLTIINSQHQDIDVVIYARGDLAKYVSFEKNILHIGSQESEKSITYTINLPQTLPKQGTNTIEIVVEETPSDYEQDTVIGGKIAVVQQLVIKSIIEGQYASLKFSSNNPDANQDLVFTYMFFNEGTEDIGVFNAEVQIFNEKSEFISGQSYIFTGVTKGEQKKESVIFNSKLLPGKYTAKTKVSYADRIISDEVSFIVGGPRVEISSLTSPDFRLGLINKMNVLVFSQWSEQINNVAADIFVRDADGKSYGVFKTLAADMAPFSTTTLIGYWDTSQINPGKYFLDIVVSYNGKFTEKEFEVDVFPDSLKANALDVVGRSVIVNPRRFDSTPMLIFAFITLIIINILLFVYIKRKTSPPMNNH